MDDSVKLGIVGTGQRGRHHIATAYAIRDATYLGSDRADGYPHYLYRDYARDAPDWSQDVSELSPEVAAMFDPSADERAAAGEICREHGDDPASFGSLEAFLDADAYDAAIVASPPDVHVDAAIPLLDTDVDVLCEKPIAPTLTEYDQLADAADRSDGLFYVGFNLRSSPFFTMLAELVDNGAVGDLGMISCRECRGPFFARYAYSEERGGGALLDKNCHDFDVFNWYADSDPVRVAAFGGQHILSKDNDVMDHASVSVEYANGIVGTLELCLYAPFGERTRMYEIRGSDGLLRSPEESGTIDLFARDRHHRFGIDDADGGHGGADQVQMVRFLRCVRDEGKPPATLLDAKKSAAVAIGGQEAARRGAVVEIDSNYDLEISSR